MMLVKNEMTKNKKKYVHEIIFPKKKIYLFFQSFKTLTVAVPEIWDILEIQQWSIEAGRNRITEYRSFGIIYRTEPNNTEPNHTLFKSSNLQI